jgi:LysM repeat protein
MNTPNPLVPQGTLERQSKGKSTIRIAIFTIISIHAVFFAGLLMQGCRRDDGKAAQKSADISTNLPPLDTGYPTQDVAQVVPPPPPAPTSAVPNIVNEVTPNVPPPAAPEPLVEGKPYTIAKGDTLAKIAKANHVTLSALTKANPTLDPSKLKVGQKIQIPPASKAAAGDLGFAEPGKAGATAGAAGLYTVKPGETLTRIAKQHGITAKSLRAANNLKTDRLVVGQHLKIPAGGAVHATADTGKTSAVSRMTSTNPGQALPIPAASVGSNDR